MIELTQRTGAVILAPVVVDPWVISQRLFRGEAERDAVFAELAEELGIDMADNSGRKRLDDMAEDVSKNQREIQEKRAREAREEEERERQARGQ